MNSQEAEHTLLNNTDSAYTPDAEEHVIEHLPDKLEKLKNRNNTGSIRFLVNTVHTLYLMVRTKEYNLSFSTKAMIVGALTYFVLPTDLTPDFIPFIGYIDDTAVIMALLRRIGSEIDRFKLWHLNQS